MVQINLPDDPNISNKRRLNVTHTQSSFTTSIDLLDANGNVVFKGEIKPDTIGSGFPFGQTKKSDEVKQAEAALIEAYENQYATQLYPIKNT